MPSVASRESGSRKLAGWALGSVVSLAALCGLGPTGCAALSFPGSSSPWTVESVVRRGPYLDVSLSVGGSTRRFFTAAGEPCLGMLHAEAVVDYVNLGPLGQFQAAGATCIPVGIGSLAAWRDERPRPQVGPLPSKQANYKLEYEDKDVAMLRGFFPLLGLIGWPGMGDSLVVVPQVPACQALIPSGVATIVYRVEGPEVYALLDNDKRCGLAGLIQPIGER